MWILNILFLAQTVDSVNISVYTGIVALGFLGGLSALYYELKIRLTKLEDRNVHLEKQIESLLQTVNSINHKLDLLTEDHVKLEAWKDFKEQQIPK